jgi:hypothetical protein
VNHGEEDDHREQDAGRGMTQAGDDEPPQRAAVILLAPR